MSSPNYGDSGLQIKIPIEIIPETKGIRKKIKEVQGREKARTGKTDDDLRKLIDSLGIDIDFGDVGSPYHPVYGRSKLTGTQNIFQGGIAPIVKSQFYQSGGNYPVPQGGGSPYTNPYMSSLGPMAHAQVPGGGVGAPIQKGRIYGMISGNANSHVLAYNQSNPGLFSRIVSGLSAYGPSSAAGAAALARNPIGGGAQIASKVLAGSSLGALGAAAGIVGIMAAVGIEATKIVLKEITKKGSVADKTFRNVISTRYEALRTRELQQRHLVGFGAGSQLITTTNAGTTSPRNAYNTYEVFNRDQAEIEEKFRIRNGSGYE
jgi:hypothetical protein